MHPIILRPPVLIEDPPRPADAPIVAILAARHRISLAHAATVAALAGLGPRGLR